MKPPKPRSHTSFVVIVDDEPQMLSTCRELLVSNGFKNILTLDDSRTVVPLLKDKGEEISLMLLDLSMPHISGQKLLEELTANFPHIPVIILTSIHDTDTAVQCIKAGAIDYLVKPPSIDRLITSVNNAIDMQELKREVRELRHYLLDGTLQHRDKFSKIITKNSKMMNLFKYIEAVAPSPIPLLITGETGVGKELIADAAHRLSGREGNFVAINAAGIDDHTFSDTLFGHVKGAFTGADTKRDGMIAQAQGGTLFFDEIGDLSEMSQIKLLRIIQEQSYYQLGSDELKKCNVRLIFATNKDLMRLQSEGKFRKDLYYRLSCHRVHIPPLRERTEDIPLLFEHFLSVAAEETGIAKPECSQELISFLRTYAFTGNVRELQGIAYDLAMRHRGGVLRVNNFKEAGRLPEDEQFSFKPDKTDDNIEDGELLLRKFGHFPTFEEMENYLVEQAMKRSNGNQSMAAGFLGVSRQALNKRLSLKKG